MSWLSKLTGVHISPKGFSLGIPGQAGGPRWNIIKTGLQYGDNGGGSFNPDSPEGQAESEGGSSGGGGIRNWLLNPGTMGLAATGLASLTNRGEKQRASALDAMKMQLASGMLDEQKFRQSNLKPLQQMAFDRIREKMEGTKGQGFYGSAISPGGRGKFQLPEYKPGERVNLNNVRGGPARVRRFLAAG